jgi:hypothetical protein
MTVELNVRREGLKLQCPYCPRAIEGRSHSHLMNQARSHVGQHDRTPKPERVEYLRAVERMLVMARVL